MKFEDLDREIQVGCERGITCSHCGQYAKMYRRKLGVGIAKFLILLHRISAAGEHGRFYTTRNLYPRDNKAASDGVMARFWGLIEVANSTNSAGAPAGAYRLTDLGRQFVNGVYYAPRYVRVYNNEALGAPEGPVIGVIESLGTKFNYLDLMRGI